MKDAELSPFNLIPGEVYFMESDSSVKWYITNNSYQGSQLTTGFSICANSGYNSEDCYKENNCQFFQRGETHAYTNLKNPKFRLLTTGERRWFNHCKLLDKFIPYNVVNIEAVYPKLDSFPQRGVCWNHTPELLDYLMQRPVTDVNSNLENYYTKPPKGLVWNNVSCWAVSTSSNQPTFDIEQLKPFFETRKTFKNPSPLYPLTPDECFFPEKWCIQNTEENIEMLTEFLHNNKASWKNYLPTWYVASTGKYFHYPTPYPNESVHSFTNKEKGYTLITTKQFITHVLTNKNNLNNKQNEQQERCQTGSSIQVQRSNFSIRNTDPIRAVGIRCSKVKIKIGSGHLPN